MKNWLGNWIIFVAFGHTVYAIAVFGGDYLSLVEHGIINSITSMRVGLAVWFFLFGHALFIIGLQVRQLELSGNRTIPKSTSLNLLLLTVVGVTIMPDSGFWLMFPAIITMLIRSKNSTDNVLVSE
ncbi:MAG: molecular chaperone GroEL [Colwellia sp.]|nr:molecular chaperone GroEL [Colwellia sp.]